MRHSIDIQIAAAISFGLTLALAVLVARTTDSFLETIRHYPWLALVFLSAILAQVLFWFPGLVGSRDKGAHRE
ncbi:hypothetical protein B0H14DRAFT_2702582 [Mycena olivaceomarginata]|nr:hypothetical protein B0H14DRAFT_2702582 [Mycena olivaceomarginata]